MELLLRVINAAKCRRSVK